MSQRTQEPSTVRRRAGLVRAGVAAVMAATSFTALAPATVASPAVAAAGVTAATVPCSVGVTGVAASGDRFERRLSASSPVQDTPSYAGSVHRGAFDDAPRALTTVFFDLDARIDGTLRRRETFFATVLGVLQEHTVTTIYRDGAVLDRQVDVNRHTSGWGGFRTLVLSDTTTTTSEGSTITLYGHHDNGALYRYRLTRGPGPVGGYVIRSAGSVPGFGAVKGLTLISQPTDADVLLANTSMGTLITIRSPHTSAMSTTVTRVRNSSWSGLSRLALERCGSGSVLAGLHEASGRIYVYTLAFVRGTSTPITGWGPTAATYPWTTFTENPAEYRPRLGGA